jgi:hypothetical protein
MREQNFIVKNHSDEGVKKVIYMRRTASFKTGEVVIGVGVNDFAIVLSIKEGADEKAVVYCSNGRTMLLSTFWLEHVV